MRADQTVATSPARIAVPPAWRWAVAKATPRLQVHPLYTSLADLTEAAALDDVVAIATDGPVDATVLSLPALRVVSFAGTGIWELVDTELAARRGIAVCNIRDYATDAVAEHTWALILATAKQIPAADRAVRTQQWPDPPWGSGLSGRTLGLLGVGSVGRRVAEIGRAFGMHVVAWSARGADRKDGADERLTYQTREEVVRASDVLSVHGRYEPGTPPLLGAAEISHLKPGAIVVNTARGRLVDAAALAAAVASGALAGAGLDVFDTEPLPADSPLLGVPNILLTPHIAAATADAQRHAVEQCVGNITEFLAGRPRNVVDLPRPRGSR